ncbi:hypothetical protein Hypma_009704 [Hypsizygus marmoreus]|uniref:CCHC-type domain-containing protein n=1 Tax=Hypsizygus marmoreus TaxID=39966 RepID=A0A369JLV8_HYPMA|nr:hypothetical protein Hypma_009704 [Hypsizygus marmoreus]
MSATSHSERSQRSSTTTINQNASNPRGASPTHPVTPEQHPRDAAPLGSRSSRRNTSSSSESLTREEFLRQSRGHVSPITAYTYEYDRNYNFVVPPVGLRSPIPRTFRDLSDLSYIAKGKQRETQVSPMRLRGHTGSSTIRVSRYTGEASAPSTGSYDHHDRNFRTFAGERPAHHSTGQSGTVSPRIYEVREEEVRRERTPAPYNYSLAEEMRQAEPALSILDAQLRILWNSPEMASIRWMHERQHGLERLVRRRLAMQAEFSGIHMDSESVEYAGIFVQALRGLVRELMQTASAPRTSSAGSRGQRSEQRAGGAPAPMRHPTVSPTIHEAEANLYSQHQPDESNEEYRRREDAARRQHRMSTGAVPVTVDDGSSQYPPSMAQPSQHAGPSAGAPSTAPNIQVPSAAHNRRLRREPTSPLRNVPHARRWADRVAYQRICNSDLNEHGHSIYEDQGVIFEGHQPIDVTSPPTRGAATAAPNPGEPGGGDDEDDGGNDNRPPPRNPAPPGGPPRGPPHGNGGGPPGGPGRGGPGGGGNGGGSHGSSHGGGNHGSGHGGRGGGGGGGGGRRGPPDQGPPDDDDGDYPGGGGGGDDWEEDGNSNARRSAAPPRRGYSMPPNGAARFTTPGIIEASEHHRNTMHERLLALCRERLSVRLVLPDGVKPRRADGKSVGTYKGGAKFSELEDWLTTLVVMLAVSQLRGRDRDQERVLIASEFLDAEARKWYNRHVIHVNRSQHRWTFEDVVIGLYDRFVHPSTMQDAREAFESTKYSADKGVQGFYDTLIDHAQNMAVWPDAYTVMDTFVQGLPEGMRDKLFDDGLSPEVNTIDDFVSAAKAYEMASKTAAHYRNKINRRLAARREPRAQATPAPAARQNASNFKPRAAAPAARAQPRAAAGNNNRAPRYDHALNAAKPAARAPARDSRPDNRPARAPAPAGDDKCFNCGQTGHYSRECPRPRKQVQLRAARTAAPDAASQDEAEDDLVEEPDQEVEEYTSQESGDEEHDLVEMELEDAEYDDDSEGEFLRAIETTLPAVPDQQTGANPVKIRKVTL